MKWQSIDLGRATFAADYDEVIAFLTRCQKERKVHHSLAVLVLAHEASEITRQYLLPYVEYWHYRTADTVDFVFPGYVGDPTLGEFRMNAEPLFSSRSFTETLRRLEGTTWSYKGEPSVLLISAIRPFGPPASEVRLDFSHFIEFDITRSLVRGVIPTVPSFFELLIGACGELYPHLTRMPLEAVRESTSLADSLCSVVLEKLRTEYGVTDVSEELLRHHRTS